MQDKVIFYGFIIEYIRQDFSLQTEEHRDTFVLFYIIHLITDQLIVIL